jgi:hypothetical protein
MNMTEPCKCGSTEHEAITSKGLAGMTTITSCPLEIEEAHERMRNAKPTQPRTIKAPTSHAFLHIDKQLDEARYGKSSITQDMLDMQQLKEMIDALDSNNFVHLLRHDKRFSIEAMKKHVISDPNNTLEKEYYDVFENNKELDMLLTTGHYHPYSKSPHIWRTVHLSDVERHTVEMIMLLNDMKDTYTMMITEGEEE